MFALKTISHKSTIFRRAVRLMGDQFEISVVGNDVNWADERIDDATAEINRVEKLLSTFSDDSIINEINRNAGVKPVKTATEIFRLIERSLQISELTHGAFDITYVADSDDSNYSGTNLQPTDTKGVLNAVNYNGVLLELGFRIDIIVEDSVIIEVKSIETLHDVHMKQVLTYLRLSGKKLGFLVNFNVSSLKDKESLIRIIN